MPYLPFSRFYWLAGWLAACSGVAVASDLPKFSFGGFATAGVVRASQEHADFTLHQLQDEGAGRSQRWSAEVDSRIAGQVRADFTSSLSAVVQVIAEQQHDGKYDPSLEWANIQYQVTPELALRAGRIVLPVFLMSDYRKVGYAQPWARPPVELYNLVPLSSSDGVHAMYRFAHEGLAHTLQFSLGKTGATMPDGSKASLDRGWLLADTMEYGALTVHAAYARARLSIQSYRPLFNGYRAIAADPLAQAFFPGEAAKASSIIAQYEPERRDTAFYGLGATYEPGPWFVTAEAGRVSSDSIYGKRRAWYVSSGYRLGAWTPYVTYARARQDGKSRIDGVGLPSAAPLNAALNGALAAIPEQNTVSIGTRWDVDKNLAVKLQYDRTRIAETSYGTLMNQAPGAPTGGSFRLISATLDIVF